MTILPSGLCQLTDNFVYKFVLYSLPDGSYTLRANPGRLTRTATAALILKDDHLGKMLRSYTDFIPDPEVQPGTIASFKGYYADKTLVVWGLRERPSFDDELQRILSSCIDEHVAVVEFRRTS